MGLQEFGRTRNIGSSWRSVASIALNRNQAISPEWSVERKLVEASPESLRITRC